MVTVGIVVAAGVPGTRGGGGGPIRGGSRIQKGGVSYIQKGGFQGLQKFSK